jgi:glucokinase
VGRAKAKAKSAQGARIEKVLAYDIGGTKVHTAIIDSRGRVHDEVRVAVDFSRGRSDVFRQWIDAGKRLLDSHPDVKRVGVASAGPLDPAKGLLLDPTNFTSAGGETWGVVPISKLLSRGLGGLPIVLENDAAAAVLAEHWCGAAKGVDDCMIITLGTGVGTGMIVDGKLVRAGRGLHTEGGHVIIRAGDESAVCGCGNLGCVEAFLSGRNFEKRARRALEGSQGTPAPVGHVEFAPGHVEAGFSAPELAARARAGEAAVVALFEEYAELLAVAIHNFVVLYAPRVVVLAGSFANAADLFLDRARERLEELLIRRRHGVDFMPRVVVSSLQNRAGVLGGAVVALRSR